MKIRTFNFPTFEEWNKKRSFEQRIGRHYCLIIQTLAAKRNDSDYEECFSFIIYYECSTEPWRLDTIFKAPLYFVKDTTEKEMKEWYKKNVTKARGVWRRTMKPYFVE